MAGKRQRVIIMGAAGRDFHNFNMVYRENPDFEVVAFTATQIPMIAGRSYPPELAGPLYPGGIPIRPEEELATLIKDFSINQVVFSYSDVSHAYVMHKASLCLALGADFLLLGPERTMLDCSRPVISVCSVRTRQKRSDEIHRGHPQRDGEKAGGPAASHALSGPAGRQAEKVRKRGG